MDACMIETPIPRSYHINPPPIKRNSQYSTSKPNEKKKESKSWLFGGLFRRRKKSIESDCSSQEDNFNESNRRSFISRKRKKSPKKDPKKNAIFDHIVIPPNGIKTNSISIDPVTLRNKQNIFHSILPHRPRGSVETSKSSHESLVKSVSPTSKSDTFNGSYGSLDSSTKKRRHRAKVRRDRTNNDSSSDEGSTASSLLRIKSDSDSITKFSTDSGSSRKTRSARTERYIKRISREEEHILNKEAEVRRQIDSPQQYMHLPATNAKKPPISNRNNSFGDIYGKITDNEIRRNRQKSWSLESNMNRSPTGETCYTPPVYPMLRPYTKTSPQPYLARYDKSPPPPPPRDPQRRVVNVPIDFPRPISYAFEPNQRKYNTKVCTSPEAPSTYSYNSNSDESGRYARTTRTCAPKTSNPNSEPRIQRNIRCPTTPNSFPSPTTYNPNSDPGIPRTIRCPTTQTSAPSTEPGIKRYIHRPTTPTSPTTKSSTEPINKRYIHRPTTPTSPTTKSPTTKSPTEPITKRYITRNPNDSYQFFTDKIPRSRKPIHIILLNPPNPYLSDSQVELNPETKRIHSVTEFWKQKEKEQIDRQKRFTSDTFRPLSMVIEKPEIAPPIPPIRRSSRQNSNSSLENTTSPVPYSSHIEPPKSNNKNINLEEALNELEEIYKSLHLGDEDLLDRAERRDLPTFKHNGTRTEESSSTDSYEIEESTGKLPRIKHVPRNLVPNTVTDDMAYRKINKNESLPKDDSLAQISYLLTSPDVNNADDTVDGANSEPDITLDDVVYRNLKHVNNSLKVIDPQPPFGIPIGPVAISANSDYLHAKPETRPRSRFIPQKLPDIVKDDLAFRSLRKDPLKDPQLSEQDQNIRKKRAVRSLSANLFNIMHQDSNNDFISDSEVNKNVEQRLRVHIPRGGEQKNDTDIEVRIQKYSSPELQAMLIDLAKQTQEDFGNNDPQQEEFGNSETRRNKEEDIETRKRQNEDIENVSEHAKLCENLLGCVLNSTELINTSVISSKVLEESQKPILINKSVEQTLSELDSICLQARNCGDLLECVVETAEILPKTPEMVQLAEDESDDNKTIPRIASTELLTEGVETVELLSDVDTSIANEIILRKPDFPTEPTMDYVDSDRLSVFKFDVSDSESDSDEDKTICKEEESTNEVLKELDLLSNYFDDNGLDFNAGETGSMKAELDKCKPINEESRKNILRAPTPSTSSNHEALPYPDTHDHDGKSHRLGDFKSVVLACAYILACTHQLAALDFFTILGIILAVISVLAAFL